MPPSSDAIRVFIADDHPLYRDGFARGVEQHPALELVGDATDGRAALREIVALAPDVAVLDVRMPGMTGIEVTKALAQAGAPTRVLILSAFTDGSLVYDAVLGGAAGYLTKDVARSEICDAITRVADGETVLSPDAQAVLTEQIRERETPDHPPLSEREREVLTHAASGLPVADIAQRMHLSAATIKGHLQAIYRKLGVHTRAAAAAEGVRLHVID